MKPKSVFEEEIRERLVAAGKSPREVERLIDEYVSITTSQHLDQEAISEILKKTQEDSELRVKGFKLTRDQFDTLVSYFEENDKLMSGQGLDANTLVRKALEQFLEVIS